MTDALNPCDCPRCGQHESYGCSCTRIEQLVAERDAKDARIAELEAAMTASLQRENDTHAKLAVAMSVADAAEALMCDPSWGIEHEAYMRLRAALAQLKGAGA